MEVRLSRDEIAEACRRYVLEEKWDELLDPLYEPEEDDLNVGFVVIESLIICAVVSLDA